MATKKTAEPDTSVEGQVQALFEFGYDSERPRVERGEVFALGGHQHDNKLLTLRYVAEVPPGTPLKRCGSCGKTFINDSTRTVHGDTWHAFTCDCGWVSPAGPKATRARDLAEHRETCEVMREQRSARRAEHRQEVKAIKTDQPIAVG